MHNLSHLSPRTLELCAHHANEVANHLHDKASLAGMQGDYAREAELRAAADVERQAAQRYKAALLLA